VSNPGLLPTPYRSQNAEQVCSKKVSFLERSLSSFLRNFRSQTKTIPFWKEYHEPTTHLS
jgi:hypothetical protein